MTATTLWAATADELAGVGGKYYSGCREVTPSAQVRVGRVVSVPCDGMHSSDG
jgi:hypothetical protein